MSERKPRNWKRIFIIFGILFTILFSIVYFRYYYVYSEGTRVGILYKFSKKGTMFKTFEGEMILPGLKAKAQTVATTSNNFSFSVTDEALANKLMESQGMEVEVSYYQYNAALPWRGDSYEGQDGQYIVTKLVRIKSQNPNAYGL